MYKRGYSVGTSQKTILSLFGDQFTNIPMKVKKADILSHLNEDGILECGTLMTSKGKVATTTLTGGTAGVYTLTISTAFADGEITAWRKDKWHQMERAPEKSYLVDLALAVQDCTAAVCNREDFCTMMEQEYGWNVIWKDTKKNITFTDCEGHRVRDSNLKKTFDLKTSKEELEHEFAKNIGKQTYNPKTIERKSATKGADLTLGSGKQLAERTAGNHSKSRR